MDIMEIREALDEATTEEQVTDIRRLNKGALATRRSLRLLTELIHIISQRT
jgi:hypothetical protein